MNRKFEVVYEDEAIILINKSSGVLSIPDRFHPEVFNLYNWLENEHGSIFVVHRLDRETSGIILFAKTREAHKNLSEQFETRTVEKLYNVLVEGVLYDSEGTIDKPIAPDPSRPGRMTVSNHGKPSLTLFRVVERFKHYTLAEADIKTGRTHQIRVHFKSIGFPLAVDELYGRQPAFLLSAVKGNKYQLGKNQEERPLMSRTSLHAAKLVFTHPESGERVTFEAPLPKDFRAVLQQLRKWDQ